MYKRSTERFAWFPRQTSTLPLDRSAFVFSTSYIRTPRTIYAFCIRGTHITGGSGTLEIDPFSRNNTRNPHPRSHCHGYPSTDSHTNVFCLNSRYFNIPSLWCCTQNQFIHRFIPKRDRTDIFVIYIRIVTKETASRSSIWLFSRRQEKKKHHLKSKDSRKAF